MSDFEQNTLTILLTSAHQLLLLLHGSCELLTLRGSDLFRAVDGLAGQLQKLSPTLWSWKRLKPCCSFLARGLVDNAEHLKVTLPLRAAAVVSVLCTQLQARQLLHYCLITVTAVDPVPPVLAVGMFKCDWFYGGMLQQHLSWHLQWKGLFPVSWVFENKKN